MESTTKSSEPTSVGEKNGTKQVYSDSFAKMGENGSIIMGEPVQDTALRIHGGDEQGYWVCLGAYRVSQKFSTLEDAREWTDKMDWRTIMNVIAVMIEAAFVIRAMDEKYGAKENGDGKTSVPV